jgi:predicted aldo/keto reductase-like oxidoreductase
MQYRSLGQTGQRVSALGFGCMRFPKIPDTRTIDEEATLALLHRARDLGVNYFDSAYVYDVGNSERTLGKFLQEIPRESVIVTTKSPLGHEFWPIPGDRPTAELFREKLDEQLTRLQTPYIDNYLFHYASSVAFRNIVTAPKGPLAEALKAKEEGLIRHIGISSHDTAANIVRIIEMGKGAIEMILVQYNLLDRRNESVIEYCRQREIGVAIMGPVGGGRLIHPSSVYQDALGVESTPEAALRFVLSNPGVSVALSGMNAMSQVEENVATADRAEALAADERARIDQLQNQNAELLGLYCTGCEYCMPCPHGIKIPDNFNALNRLRVHGMADLARVAYQALKEEAAEHCVECGGCAGRCPQHIDIPSRLKEVAKELSSL